MASKNVKKDETAPPLLLMPAGKGLTMNTSLESFSSNVLLPVAQPESTLIASDVDAEVDSFVGQSPPRNASASDLFSKSSEPDCPFSNIGQLQGNRPSSQTSQRSSFGDLFGARAKSESPSVSQVIPAVQNRPIFQKAQPSGIGVTLFGAAPPVQNQSQPVMAPVQLGATPPLGVSAGPPQVGQLSGVPGQSQNYHRPAAGPRYAPPTNLYTTSHPSSSPFNATPSPPVAEVSPMPNANLYYAPQPGYNTQNQPSYPQASSNFAPSQSDASVNLSMSASSASQSYPDYTQQYSTSQPQYAAGSPTSAGSPGTLYTPVQPHWFYCKIGERTEWLPMSLLDSLRLEEGQQQYCHTGHVDLIATDGGRYDVDLTSHSRKAVYWHEEPTEVRRCTWFFKNEGDNRFIPYEEDFAAKLEEEYRTALLNNVWHKRLEFPGGEMIVIHNPNVIVHFRPSSLPDEWGTTQGEQLRPRVVKRGIEEFENIQDGENEQIDHLVLVVHGIGRFCDIKFRNLVRCVDDMRANSHALLDTHFKRDQETGRIGRVEFLPVHWHQALHGDNTGIDRNLRRITLKSIPKLRSYTNDTLLDILFYTSPKYCQTIINTACSEMNRLHALFRSRNPDFKGNFSTAGHSLGSAILFDLLCHQTQHEAEDIIESESEAETVESEPESEPEPEDDLTLVSLLDKLELSEFLEKFETEHVDLKTLMLFSDKDMKEMGLPVGPRKKLQAYLQDQQECKMRARVAAQRRARLLKDRKSTVNSLAVPRIMSILVRDPLLPNACRSSVNFLSTGAGTGQPYVTYPKVNFRVANFFALGSPIALFLSTRGINRIGDEYRLPAGCGMFNIFHPFDPVAYRIEPLIMESFSEIKPVLIPHHKGRKRLHLELKESLAKVGADIKQKIMDSLRSTWNSLNDFARAHRTLESGDQDVDDMLNQIASATDDTSSVAESVTSDEDISIGYLNGGRRIDYVLQEKPIESFNDYLFALASHGCYWESEDTALLILKETYAMMGVYPEKKGPNSAPVYDPRAPPPMAGFQRQNPLPTQNPVAPPIVSVTPPTHVPLHTVDQSRNVSQSNYEPFPTAFNQSAGRQNGHSQSQFGAPPNPNYGVPPSHFDTPSAPQGFAPPPNSDDSSTRQFGGPPQASPAPPKPVGPPPMAGFVRKS